jgi:hypothetical protein
MLRADPRPALLRGWTKGRAPFPRVPTEHSTAQLQRIGSSPALEASKRRPRGGFPQEWAQRQPAEAAQGSRIGSPARPNRSGSRLVGTLAHRISVQAPHRPPHPGRLSTGAVHSLTAVSHRQQALKGAWAGQSISRTKQPTDSPGHAPLSRTGLLAAPIGVGATVAGRGLNKPRHQGELGRPQSSRLQAGEPPPARAIAEPGAGRSGLPRPTGFRAPFQGLTPNRLD